MSGGARRPDGSAIGLLEVSAFNAAYARAIDSDALEEWPAFFTDRCRYRITHVENQEEGLAAGIVYADSRAMLEDRVSALREANIYERQRYRHLIGFPHFIEPGVGLSPAVNGTVDAIECVATETPFLVVRIMSTGEQCVFASGVYLDRFVVEGERLLLDERTVVCDSTSTDTLMALPL